jgi:hypothetical protein
MATGCCQSVTPPTSRYTFRADSARDGPPVEPSMRLSGRAQRLQSLVTQSLGVIKQFWQNEAKMTSVFNARCPNVYAAGWTEPPHWVCPIV